MHLASAADDRLSMFFHRDIGPGGFRGIHRLRECGVCMRGKVPWAGSGLGEIVR